MLKWGIGVAAATLATAFAGGAAQAQQSYVAAGIGWTRIDSANTTIENGVSAGNPIVMSFDLDDDWRGSAAYGLDYGSLRFEGELSMTKNEVNTWTSFKPANLTRQADGKVGLISLMANAYWDFDMGPGITPFVGVGGGAMRANVDFAGPRPTAPNAAAVTIVDNDKINIGWQMMAGFSTPIAGNMLLTAQARYFDAGTFDMNDTLGHATDISVKGMSWDAGVRWTF
ncbi:MAG: outer membrane beta-barrel protein [Hyphomonadaceae bacterium]